MHAGISTTMPRCKANWSSSFTARWTWSRKVLSPTRTAGGASSAISPLCMQPDEADAAHLWDMHRFATEVAALVEGMDYHAFVADWPKRRAVERCIEIIGEAASHV